MPTINEAFKTHGIRAEYEGMPAMVVPVTPELAETLDQEKVKKPAISGNMLLSWNNGDERKGLVINSLAANDINLLIKRQDGSDKKVNATSMTDAALRALRLRRSKQQMPRLRKNIRKRSIAAKIPPSLKSAKPNSLMHPSRASTVWRHVSAA